MNRVKITLAVAVCAAVAFTNNSCAGVQANLDKVSSTLNAQKVTSGSSKPAQTPVAFTDPRDGKNYKIAKIGKQVWMAENLNYEASNSKCYDNNPENCDKYGRLYNQTTAMNACPQDWYLPSFDDWKQLFCYITASNCAPENRGFVFPDGGGLLKAKSGWDDIQDKSGNGNDKYGFAALPGGKSGPGGDFIFGGMGGFWWSTSDGGIRMSSRDEKASSGHDKESLYSVRCVHAEDIEDVEGVAFDSFIDPRDSKTYRTVKIGTQTWMAQNLKYKAKDSECYDNKSENCDRYGRYYDWNTARNACPSGWHLPSDTEWDELLKAAGGGNAGRHLKTQSGWTGTVDNSVGLNTYGFTAIPGSRNSKGRFTTGYEGKWWSASESNANDAYRFVIIDVNLHVSKHGEDKGLKMTIRCVKD